MGNLPHDHDDRPDDAGPERPGTPDAPPSASRLGGGADPLDDLVVLRPKGSRRTRPAPPAAADPAPLAWRAPVEFAAEGPDPDPTPTVGGPAATAAPDALEARAPLESPPVDVDRAPPSVPPVDAASAPPAGAPLDPASAPGDADPPRTATDPGPTGTWAIPTGRPLGGGPGPQDDGTPAPAEAPDPRLPGPEDETVVDAVQPGWAPPSAGGTPTRHKPFDDAPAAADPDPGGGEAEAITPPATPAPDIGAWSGDTTAPAGPWSSTASAAPATDPWPSAPVDPPADRWPSGSPDPDPWPATSTPPPIGPEDATPPYRSAADPGPDPAWGTPDPAGASDVPHEAKDAFGPTPPRSGREDEEFAVPQSSEPLPPPDVPAPSAAVSRRKERVRKLKRAGLVTTGAGLVGAGGVLGWLARDVIPGGDVGGTNVTLTRPVQIESQPVASNTLPSVTGLGTDAAIQAYTDAGVDRQRITTEEVPYVGASGTVVRQNPAATAQIPGKGTPIVLSIAKQATMPTLSGTPSDQARAALADLGVGVTTVTEYEQGAKPGTVIRSRPAAGERAQTQATLVVSEVASSIDLSQLDPAETDGCATEDVGGQQVITCSPQDGKASIEYPSNGKVTNLRGTIALGPDSVATRARVLVREVGAGGVGVKTRQTLTVTGAGARFDVPLKGGSTIRIEALPNQGGDSAVQVRISDGQIAGARSGIDALDKGATP
ncbi:PASTA domain-containing protein [Patulibacter sp. NPDC049589]|uniref:PASTA domain-containing protein n=1 Tax=Patulibacter sp. NPDC049589 TaxID=3154731 RepID=UPI003414A699